MTLWTQLEAEYPYHIPFDAPEQSALKEQLGRLQEEMKCDIPAIHVDWFIATASLPPLYHDLLALPLTDRELETRLEVDVIRNLLNAPGVRVWRGGHQRFGRFQSQPSHRAAYPLAMARIGRATTLQAALGHRTSSPTRSLLPTMVGRLSSIFPTGYKPTTLPMRLGSVWMKHQ